VSGGKAGNFAANPSSIANSRHSASPPIAFRRVWTPLVGKQIPDTMAARDLTKEQVSTTCCSRRN